MKKLIFLLTLASSVASAEIVTVTGYGKDYETSLNNAKIAALEKVTGTWIHSQSRSIDGSYNEDITQYNGGVIKSYDVISAAERQVTIRADVDIIKDNRVGSRSASIHHETKNDLVDKAKKNIQLSNAVSTLDSKNKAFAVNVKDIQYANFGQNTQVTIYAEMAWSPKWYSDVKSLATTVDNRTQPSNNVRNQVAANVTRAMSVSPITAVLGSIFYQNASEKPREHQAEPSICFGTRRAYVADDCYVMNFNLNNFVYSSFNLRITGLALDGTKHVETNTTFENSKMYSYVLPGTQKRSMIDVTYTYNNPTLILYSEENVKLKMKFTVPTNQLAQVDKFDFTFIN